jgi:hypothetical protein
MDKRGSQLSELITDLPATSYMILRPEAASSISDGGLTRFIQDVFFLSFRFAGAADLKKTTETSTRNRSGSPPPEAFWGGAFREGGISYCDSHCYLTKENIDKKAC